MKARQETTKQRRLAKREAERQREEGARRRQRRVRWLWLGGGVVVVAVIVAVIVVASRVTAAPTIDGIQCVSSEGAATHIHQHLTIDIKGQAFPLPAGIGIDDSQGCLYALHTHSGDGVVHVEAPSSDTYTLGQFFDIWQSPLGRKRLLTFAADRTHSVRAFVNGRLYRGDPRAITLTPHALITLEYGPPWVAPTARFAWPQGT